MWRSETSNQKTHADKNCRWRPKYGSSVIWYYHCLPYTEVILKYCKQREIPFFFSYVCVFSSQKHKTHIFFGSRIFRKENIGLSRFVFLKLPMRRRINFVQIADWQNALQVCTPAPCTIWENFFAAIRQGYVAGSNFSTRQLFWPLINTFTHTFEYFYRRERGFFYSVQDFC